MPVGTSGRVVIDLDAKDKKKIYQELKARGLTMREWFQLKAIEDGLFDSERRQNPMPPVRQSDKA